MISATNRRETIARLADGDDLLEVLRAFPLTSAVIAGGIGMVRALRLGYWNGHAYEEARIDEPAELLSMQGTIASSADGRAVHCHVSVAGRDGIARGGHLLGATVANTAEIVLLLVPGVRLERRPDGAGPSKLFPLAEDGASP